MKLVNKIEKVVSNFYFGKRNEIKTTGELDKRIINDALPAYEQSLKTQSASKQPTIGRIIMRSKMIKLTAAAVILIAVILGINFPGAPIDGASTVFAAAINHVKQARTFSCTQIIELAYEDNREGKFPFKYKEMFKEPNLDRYVKLTSPTPRFVGEIRITDYRELKRLVINPVKKTAVLSDISYEYHIDPKTGKLIQQTQLDTRLRDRLLKLTAEAVEDLGTVKLNGQSVRMLQSTQDGRVITVWVDPKTNYPIQIEFKRINQNSPEMIYTDIKIDIDLDEDLFSLEPPEGYTFMAGGRGWPDAQNKISTKMRHLLLNCIVYAAERNGQYPKELKDLKVVGVTNQVLKNLITSEDNPDSPVLMRYRPPREDSDPSEVILYQIFEKWPEDGAVAGFADGHTEIISDKNRFEQLIK